MRRATILLITLWLGVLTSSGQDVIRIAAASDLKFALDSIAAVFKSRSGKNLDIIYGSSGKLFEQISNGAPFDVFFSADISYPQRLQAAGRTASDVYAYGMGRIVLWSKRLDPSTQGMDALVASTARKIAIANPTHAPYGKRAEESLRYYQLWNQIKARLVFGENIAQTAQFVTTGAADIGIIALSLAVSPNMKSQGGHYYVIPAESHEPLIQGVVVTLHGKENRLAQDFFQYVRRDEAQAILNHYGFSKPK